MSFWCLQISKKTKFCPRFLPYLLKRGQIKKIRALYKFIQLIGGFYFDFLTYTTFLIWPHWFFGRFEDTKRTFWNQLTFSTPVLRKEARWSRLKVHVMSLIIAVLSLSWTQQVNCWWLNYVSITLIAFNSGT